MAKPQAYYDTEFITNKLLGRKKVVYLHLNSKKTEILIVRRQVWPI